MPVKKTKKTVTSKPAKKATTKKTGSNVKALKATLSTRTGRFKKQDGDGRSWDILTTRTGRDWKNDKNNA